MVKLPNCILYDQNYLKKNKQAPEMCVCVLNNELTYTQFSGNIMKTNNSQWLPGDREKFLILTLYVVLSECLTKTCLL